MGWMRRAGAARVLRIAGTAIGLLLLLRGINVSQAAAVLGRADPRLELLAVGLTGIGMTCAIGAWATVAAATGASVRFPRLASWYLQGIFVGHVTPSGAGGDATRAARLSRAVGHGRGVASVAATRMATGLGVAFWGLVGAVLARVEFGVPVLVAASVYLAVMLTVWWLALASHRAARALPRSRSRALATCGRAVAPITEALHGLRATPGALGRCAGLAIAGWLLNILALQTFAAAVGVHQPPSVFAVAVPLSLLATLAPVTINGIGLREGVLVGLLVHLGEPAANAGALALLIDLQLVPFALIGAGLFVRSRRQVPATLAPATA